MLSTQIRQLARLAERLPVIRAFQGIVLSIGAPTGWLLVQQALGINALAHLAAAPGVYIYMLLGTALAFAGFGVYMGIQEEQARKTGLRDDVTGFYTSRYFLERFREAYGNLQITPERPVSLLIVELKDLNLVGNRHGASVEQKLLTAIGSEVRQARKPGEIIGQLRQGRFAVLLDGVGQEEARRCAERFGYAFQGAHVSTGMKGLAQSRVAVGLATARVYEDDGHSALLHDAIRAALRARGEATDRLVIEQAFPSIV